MYNYAIDETEVNNLYSENDWTGNTQNGELTVLATGISLQTQIRTVIKESGFEITDIDISDISSSTLNGESVLVLFRGGQTWNGTPAFSNEQASDIVNYVQNGGLLYITSRKAYENVLNPLGVTVSGSDGGSSGFSWGIIEKDATNFTSHAITNNLTSVKGDVGATFSLDANWAVIGKSSSDQDLIAIREYGNGNVVFWYAQRSYRDPKSNSNVYETDISEGSNKQFFINIFDYFKLKLGN